MKTIGRKRICATEQECSRASALFSQIQKPEAFPLSYTLDNVRYQGLPENATVTKADDERLTITAKQDNGLMLTAEMRLYPAHAALEWTVWFENTHPTEELPLLENICAADMVFEGAQPHLYGNIGDDPFYMDIYRPVEMDIVPGMMMELQPYGGRACSMGFPYYDLAYGDGGVRISVGWPGRWRAVFEGEQDRTHFTAGQYVLRAKLRPGERIRTPLMSFLFYDGHDRERSVNLWRRWFIDCNLRRVDGELFQPFSSLLSTADLHKVTEEMSVKNMRACVENGFTVDYSWIDAGWYRKNQTESISRWEETGEFACDPVRFKDEFRTLSSYLRENGKKLLVWAEPERVLKGIGAEIEAHPEWLMEATEHEEPDMGKFTPCGWCEENYLTDLGNPAYREWLLEKMDAFIRMAGVDLYRQDCNIETILFWTSNDVDGRRGLRENFYIQGYLAFWDELIRRFPNMMIDSCASGGRRNDLETMRRSVPLHLSDYDSKLNDQRQAIAYTGFGVFPFFGVLTMVPFTGVDKYQIYSLFFPSLPYMIDVWEEGTDIASLKQYDAVWRRLNKYFYADYYPLSPWSCADTVWMGWELFDPEKEAGYFQLFRRENSADETYTVRLKGLSPELTYRLERDDGVVTMATGHVLMTDGYTVSLPPRDSVVFFISAE